MLKISFYNICQKYVAETEPFKNGQINKQLHNAHEIVSSHVNIAGYTIFERVGGNWLPYKPFNGSTTYDKRQNINMKGVTMSCT